MKLKKITISLTLFLSLPVTVVSAQEQETTQDEGQNIENRINYEIAKSLESANVDKMEDLSQEEASALLENVNAIKSEYMDYYTRTKIIDSKAANPYYGNIFATTDEKKFGIRHGHAGIGGFNNNDVIEANPGDGVKLYTNRINTYWRTNSDGGIYGVSGANANKYRTATNYAVSKIGKRYGFNSFDNNDFYCSELVYYAWDSAGYNIASMRIWGEPILPLQLMVDSDTYLKEAF